MLSILREYEYCVGYKNEDSIKYSFLYPTMRYWFADPIPALINDKKYLFVEAYDKFNAIGRIAVTELSEKIHTPKIIINEPFHMSFPNVFKWHDEYYMIPETNDADQIRVYKMYTDVYDWRLVSCMDVNDRKYTDVSSIQMGDELFLVAGEKDPKDRFKCRTVIMKVLSLEKELRLEIVSQNSEYSYGDRNAGNIFVYSGELYRPIQHSDKDTYGLYVTLHKFKELENSNSAETTVRTIDINSEGISQLKGCIPYGIHTYGHIDGWDVIDVGVKRLSLDGLLVKVMRRIIKG